MKITKSLSDVRSRLDKLRSLGISWLFMYFIVFTELCDLLYTECAYLHNNNSNSSNSILSNNLNSISDIRNVSASNSNLSRSPKYTSESASSPSSQQHPYTDIRKLHKIVMDGLNINHLPDIKHANISQREYEEKYNLYLQKVRERKERERIQAHQQNSYDDDEEELGELFTFSAMYNKTFAQSSFKTYRKERNRRRRRSIDEKDLLFVRFKLPEDTVSTDIEEATLRLMLITSHNQLPHKQMEHNIKVYKLIQPYNRVWLDTYQLNLSDVGVATQKWIEFDVSKAIRMWLEGETNFGFEIYCDSCRLNGIHLIQDDSEHTSPENGPVLNIVTKVGQSREKRSRQHQHMLQNARRKVRRTDCDKDNHKCCRHVMEVIFKEIKEFQFIIQPKVFDAGYCRGKCPARYNPAHHHALLQSLIWKQDKNKAPRPCCAPAKLVELEILHVDEEDNSKLKVSTWNDMRVLECACS